jgi:hypothetical protein
MRSVRLVLVSVCGAALALGVGLAQHDHGAETPHVKKIAVATPDVAESLSPKLRGLLDKEMWQIDNGMGNLATAISLGDWKTVAETASKIRDSFILEQQLTEEDAEELHEKLPAEFLRLDRRFHETAGNLVHAANNRDAELATFYHYRLMDSCVHCHVMFAPQRFPGLVGSAPEQHKH